MSKNKKNKLKKVELKKYDIVSTTECTGLMPSLPDTAAEEKAIKDIYDIP